MTITSANDNYNNDYRLKEIYYRLEETDYKKHINDYKKQITE